MIKTTSRQLITLLAILAMSQGVQAHNSLTGSNPEAGSTIPDAPSELVLEFSDPAWLDEVTVTDSEGKDVAGTMEEAAAIYSVYTVPLKPDEMKNGEYTVNWTVEGTDTHIITGEFTFILQQQVTNSIPGEDGNEQ